MNRPRLLSQILGGCLIALALLMALSLLSHSPEDPPNSTRPLEHAENLIGWIGAHLSYYLLFGVGYGVSCGLTACVFMRGWYCFRIADAKPFSVYSVAWFFAAAVIFCSAMGVLYAEDSSTAWRLGGWLGFMLSSSLLLPYLGKVGSYILLTALFVLLVLGLFRIVAREARKKEG